MRLKDFKEAAVNIDSLSLPQTLDFRRKWVDLFAEKNPSIPLHKCPNCKGFAKGDYWGYDWHGISYRDNSSEFQCEGYVEILNSLSMGDAEVVVIFEENCSSPGLVAQFRYIKKFLCVNKGKGYEDIYITPKDLSWTLVLTHERGWFGPYFVKKEYLSV